jgi:hypothetical protein
MKRTILILNWIIICLMMGSVLLISFWLFYPYKTVTFKQPFKVLNSPVKAGSDMYIQVEYCKYTTEIPTVTSHFIDGIAYDVPTKPVTAKEMGCGVTTITENVPINLPPGNFKDLQRVYTYRPNPIRTINVVTITEPFTITK